MKNKKIGIIGLGYVGLPLLVEFAKKNFFVIGFDIDSKRINELNNCIDNTKEIDNKALYELKSNNKFQVTQDLFELKDCNVYIVTVPTPIDKYKNPNFSPLISASKSVGKIISKKDIVIYESTVYPGATEEVCIPLIETESKLKFNKDFFAGYSPERINPGDKVHTLTNIVKITSGSTPKISKVVDDLYKSIIKAGTYNVSSIKVAEAAKVIENSQRDINIAFMNELSKIFNLMNIDTNEVIDAACSKWNFLDFRPGLVGGHCIGVDPYYLSHKSIELGYSPEVILSGRRVNDSMGSYVVQNALKILVNKGFNPKECKVLIMGFTFKENCPDIRNTKVIDIYNGIKNLGSDITLFDPIASVNEISKHYKIKSVNKIASSLKFHLILMCVNHSQFCDFEFKKHLITNGVLIDVKNKIDSIKSDFSL